MPTYHPTPGNASQLNFQFGYINTSGNLVGSTLTVNLSDGIGFVPGDVGLVIQIVKPGVAGYPIWTQVATYSAANSVTITATPASNQLGCQVVLYRELPAKAHVRLDDGVTGTSSIRNLPTLDFNVYSSDGLFSPREGQPILVTHATYGDLFGGYIEQATIDNSPGNITITTKCECVAWDKRLGQRLLYLANENNPSTTEQFVSDGSSREYHLLAVPTNVTAINLIGSIAVSGGVGTIIYGAEFYAGVGTTIVMNGVTYPITGFPSSTTVNIGGSPPNTSGVAYAIPQTFNTAGADTTSQWFWDQASNTITQGYQAGNSLSETLQPHGGVFNMVSFTFNYSAQLVYENISVTDLIQSIMGLIADEGFSVTITLAGGVPTITQIQFTKRDTPQSALQAIVDQINDGTTNYWFRSSPRKNLLFEILGVTRAAPWNISSLDGSDGNVSPKMSSAKTLEKYVNSALVDVAAAQGSQQLTQNIVGGSPPRRSWGVSAPIAATPTVIRYSFITNPITGAQKWVSAPQTVGLLNDPITGQGQMWYWSPGSPSLTQDPVIGFALGYTFGGVAIPEYLVVTFYPQVSLVQSYVDAAAVAARIAIEGGSGEYDTYVTPKSLANIAGSANSNYAQAVVGTYHDVSQTVECTTTRGGLFPGMSIVVHINELGVDLTMVVDKVNLSEEQDMLRWSISLVFGAVIGDYRTAWKSVGGGSSGISGLGSPSGTAQPTSSPVLWSPTYETPLDNVLFTSKSFGVAQVYGLSDSGSPQPALAIYGDPPSLNPAISLLIKIRRELISGNCAQVCAAVTTGHIALGGVTITDQFKGRIISKLANALGSTGNLSLQDFTITGNDNAGNFAVTPDPAGAGCVAGDLFTIRTGRAAGTAPTAYDLVATFNSVQDPLLVSVYNPGLVVDSNKGCILLCIGGQGAFQPPQLIIGNTRDTLNVSPGFLIKPDATTVLVVVDAIPQVSPPDATGGGLSQFLGNILIPNYTNKVMRVEGYLVRSDGQPLDGGSIETVVFREIFAWGQQGTRQVTSSGMVPMLVTDGQLRHYTVGGNQTLNLLKDTDIPDRLLVIHKVTGDGNTVTVNLHSGNTFPDGSTSLVLSDNGANGLTVLKFPGDGSGIVVPVSGVGSLTPSGTAVSFVQTVALVAGANAISYTAPITDGQTLYLSLVYPASGVASLTWGGMFSADTPTDINPLPSGKTRLVFVAIGGVWEYWAMKA